MQISRVTFLVCVLLAATPCFAQETKTEIIYTGKLMGYFRSPDKQPRNQSPGCKATNDSSAAARFQELRIAKPHAVLVGTGDNFSPELEARVFAPKPDSGKIGVPPDEYAPGNKELYYWNNIPGQPAQWIYYKDLKNHPELEAELALGNATIPTDNVGCFLATNRFAAIVPGKHDFYFGVERVRALARFMAGLKGADFAVDMGEKYRPPQMLGANLVIKTSRTAAPSLTAKSLVGYRFISPAGTFECRPEVTQTFADCIKKLSNKSDPKLTINSDASAILDSRPRAGFYWKAGFTLPINSKMSYVFSDKGDLFFNFSSDNATDTRYRSDSKHSLKFTIWPSLSIGPSLRLLLYRNKVNKDFLFQKEFGFETSFAFDLFNRREKEVQIKHKP